MQAILTSLQYECLMSPHHRGCCASPKDTLSDHYLIHNGAEANRFNTIYRELHLQVTHMVDSYQGKHLKVRYLLMTRSAKF